MSRRTNLVLLVAFTLASTACALAPSPDALIAFRVLQGGFGALLIPQGLGVIKTVFPPKEMGGAFAAFGPVMGLAAIAGPILAGWLVTADLLGTGWRMIFLINVPLGVVGLLGALRFMPESRAAGRIRSSNGRPTVIPPAPRRTARRLSLTGVMVDLRRRRWSAGKGRRRPGSGPPAGRGTCTRRRRTCR